MHRLTKNNFYILSGGPGSGKTSVLNALTNKGYLTVPEVSRKIIKEQIATGGNATHAGDRNAFCQLMLEYSIADYQSFANIPLPIFFDRALPELIAYVKRFCGGINEEIKTAVDKYRYHSPIFLFPPWQEIYCQDEERKQNFQDAIDTYEAVKSAYEYCGYPLVEVPKDTIENRAIFILAQI